MLLAEFQHVRRQANSNRHLATKRGWTAFSFIYHGFFFSRLFQIACRLQLLTIRVPLAIAVASTCAQHPLEIQVSIDRNSGTDLACYSHSCDTLSASLFTGSQVTHHRHSVPDSSSWPVSLSSHFSQIATYSIGLHSGSTGLFLYKTLERFSNLAAERLRRFNYLFVNTAIMQRAIITQIHALNSPSARTFATDFALQLFHRYCSPIAL